MPNKKPKISIIIPMYNVEKYLKRCLDSVRAQTFADFQAILVDDGSPDKSGEIAESYAEQDKRFVVIHKENGGLSDARNVGMSHASGEYIMYLDSDDFIHPQTMEIAYSLAQRDNSDIVSFTYDRLYRPQLMIRHKLGMTTDDVVPRGIKKHYDINKIKSRKITDVYEYATDSAHNAFRKNRKWLVKHCQVWKNLYRRDLIADIPFIKGILFEDFPWWSRVMLRNPTVTVAPLPLYYYIPNFGGIVLSAKQLRIMQSLITGIKDSFVLYSDQASVYQMNMWSKNFLWFFVAKAFSKVKYLKTVEEINLAKQGFTELYEIGVFRSVPKSRIKLAVKILDFIDK